MKKVSIEKKKCEKEGRIRHKYDHFMTESLKYMGICKFCGHVNGNPYIYI